jgi:hypothetical protein
MTDRKKRMYFWCIVIVALLVGAISSCGNVYLRLGTDVMGSFPSPNGKWDALVMVRDGGAMTGFSTQISVIRSRSLVGRQIALFRPANAFIADSNHGTAPSGGRGQVNVSVHWNSNEQVTITYAKGARVFKQSESVPPVSIDYVRSP